MSRAGAPARDTNNVQKAVLQAADGIDIGDVDVATIAGVAPQMDDTDKLAVSLHGKATAAGDTPVGVTSAEHLMASIYDALTGNTVLFHRPQTDGFATSGWGLSVTSRSQLYNESTLDRQRNNTETTLLASAARTATTSSADQTNHNARGVLVTLDVTAVTDTPSITLVVQAKMGNNYEALLTASAAVTATGTHSYIVYPGVGAASGDVTQVAGFPLPRTWRVTLTHGDSDSITYSVESSLIL